MGRGRKHRARHAADSRPSRRPLALHPLFGAVLGLWGAALGGLVVLVLPRNLVLEAAAQAGLAMIGASAPFVLAALAALVLGAAMFVLAKLLTRAAAKARRPQKTPSLAAMALREVPTINPALDLGSRRLDDPLEALPFTGLKPAVDDAAQEDAEPAEAAPPPVELDLAQFAALPGRNAVWVEDVAAPAPAAEPFAPSPELPAAEPVLAAVPPAPRPPAPSAIEHLRAVPTSELSLVQMVERFAAALHEHQSVPPGAGGHRADQASREAALAEALKALAAFGPEAGAPTQGEPLRAALARLQELRGAA